MGSLSFAQLNDSPDCKGERQIPALQADNYQDRATPFWTEDFSNGFPSDWAIIDSSGICPWTYTMDGSWGFWSTSGENSADNPMASTTAGNGFLICDNDSANHVNYGQPSGTTYQYLASYFGTSAIDCSTHGSVILRFEQSYRYNNGVPMWVQVSTDSVSWTAFDVSGGLANNTASADPDVEVLNLSTIAANQPTVYLRFGWSARVYFWMIDDISLAEADPNDVSQESGYWGTGTFQNQYFKIPMSQVSPVTFYGGLSNQTAGTLTDCYYDVDVSNGGSVYTGTSNLLTLNSTELDTAISTTDWTPGSEDTYDVTYTAAVTGQTDGNLTNNVSTSQVDITTSTYGLDNLPPDLSGASGGISNWSGNTGNSFGIGNLYEVINTGEIHCVEIGITDQATNEGSLVYAAVYYWDGSAWTYLSQTADHTVAAADLDNTVTLSFSTPVAVTAGQELIVVAAHYGGNDVQFMMAQTVPNQMVWGYDGAAQWFWLSNPRAIVSRPIFASCGLSTEELTLSNSFNAYPNPTQDIATIELELNESASVQYVIYDINGRVILESDPTNFTVGAYQIPVEMSNLSNGTYTIEVRINEQRERQMIVKQ